MKYYNLWIIFILCCINTCFAVPRIINRSGVYSLGEDIMADPLVNDERIIVIAVSDVTFDMAGHTISQKSTNTQTGIVGIEVNEQLENITIRNGNVRCCSGIGIVVNKGCSDVLIDYVTTYSCASGGVHCIGTNTDKISNFDIENCKVLQSCFGLSAQYALFLQHCAGFRITNCRVNNNGISSHDISAVRLDNCATGRIADVRANSNTGALNARGFDCSAINDCLFFGCFVRNNNPTLTNGVSVGFELQVGSTCVSNTFQECIAFVNKASVTGGTVYGFRVGSTNNNNIFDRCKALDNTSTSDTTGFLCTANMRNTFSDCFARGNNSVSGTARGFNSTSGTGNRFIRCFSNENNSTNAIAVGIDTTSDTECIFHECLISRNDGSTNTNSFGLRQTSGTNNVFIKNIASYNGTTAGNQFSGLGFTQRTDANTNTANATTGPWTNVGIT